MSNLLNSFTGKGKNELSPIEHDAYIEEVVGKYVSSYLRNRIYLAHSSNTSVSEDPGYKTIVEFLASINNEFNFMRMWSPADMKNTIWPTILSDEIILRFVFKGTTLVSVKSFINDEQFEKLITHVAGALSCLSFKDNSIIDDDAFIGILPRNDELIKLFRENQWALFLYYLTRIDIIQLVRGGSEEKNDE